MPHITLEKRVMKQEFKDRGVRTITPFQPCNKVLEFII